MLILELYEDNNVRHHYFMRIKGIIFLPLANMATIVVMTSGKPIRIVFGFQKFDKICISTW